RPPAQEVLEAAAVDLPRRRRQQPAHAQLGTAVDVHAALGEEEPEAELAHLRAVEMVAQPEHVGEVVRADLDRRFADLERGLAHRVRVALEHRHAQPRVLPAQLDCQRQSGQAAAEDGDIGVGGVRLHAHPVRSTPVILVDNAANSPSGSSITGGRERQRRYSATTSPWPQTWATTWVVILRRSWNRRKWLLRITVGAPAPA